MLLCLAIGYRSALAAPATVREIARRPRQANPLYVGGPTHELMRPSRCANIAAHPLQARGCDSDLGSWRPTDGRVPVNVGGQVASFKEVEAEQAELPVLARTVR